VPRKIYKQLLTAPRGGPLDPGKRGTSLFLAKRGRGSPAREKSETFHGLGRTNNPTEDRGKESTNLFTVVCS